MSLFAPLERFAPLEDHYEPWGLEEDVPPTGVSLGVEAGGCPRGQVRLPEKPVVAEQQGYLDGGSYGAQGVTGLEEGGQHVLGDRKLGGRGVDKGHVQGAEHLFDLGAVECVRVAGDPPVPGPEPAYVVPDSARRAYGRRQVLQVPADRLRCGVDVAEAVAGAECYEGRCLCAMVGSRPGAERVTASLSHSCIQAPEGLACGEERRCVL